MQGDPNGLGAIDILSGPRMQTARSVVKGSLTVLIVRIVRADGKAATGSSGLNYTSKTDGAQNAVGMVPTAGCRPLSGGELKNQLELPRWTVGFFV